MQQAKHDGVHNRRQFQIDRVAFFSDAVIAIAITLMVLEIKISPVGENASLRFIITKYGYTLLIHATALFICFVTVGNLWIKHHELYEHVINYNRALIKRNLYFLLTVVLLPVSISFMFGKDNPTGLKLFAFFLNLCLCNLTYYFMLVVIFHKENNFSVLNEIKKIKKDKQSALWSSIIFAVVAVLALLNVDGFYLPFFIWPFLRMVRRINSFIKERRMLKNAHKKPVVNVNAD